MLPQKFELLVNPKVDQSGNDPKFIFTEMSLIWDALNKVLTAFCISKSYVNYVVHVLFSSGEIKQEILTMVLMVIIIVFF